MSKFAVVISAIAGILAAALAWGSDDGHRLKLKRATIDTGSQVSPAPQGVRGLTGAAKGGNFYIVQFDGPVMEEWKESLRKEGVRLYSYIPENAFLAKLDPKANASVIFKPHVRSIMEYKPEYRVSVELEKNVAQRYRSLSAFASEETILPLHVKVFDGEPLRPIISVIEQMDGKVEVLSDGNGLNEKLLEVEVPFYRATGIAGIPGVEWVESAPKARLCMDQARVLTTASIAQGLPRPLDGHGEVVGILDTGLDTGDKTTVHQAFRGRIKGAKSYRSDNNWRDEMGHGTVVAGVMAGGSFLAPYQGMAPGAKLFVQSGQTFATYMITPPLDTSVFLDAFKAGVRVHNNSWETMGGSLGEYDLQSVQADTFTWTYKAFLPVFVASGHSQDKYNNYVLTNQESTLPDGIPELGSIPPPGTAKNVVTVGGTQSNKPAQAGYGTYRDVFGNQSSSFANSPIMNWTVSGGGLDQDVMATSGRGPTKDGRIKPDLVAPGTVIETTYSSFPNRPLDGFGEYGYAGESVSAAMVTGGAALVRQYYREMRGVAKPSSALLKATLINGAKDIGTWNASSLQPFQKPDFHQGWGRLDVMGSVYPGQTGGDPAVAPTSFLAFVDYQRGLPGTNTGRSYPFKIISPGPVRVTLVWTDYPAAAGAGEQLVNNLDLTVISPEGWAYTGKDIGDEDPNRPWYHDPEPLVYDHTNNVESVEFTPTMPGDFFVNIQGTNIPVAPQPFAIVVTGGLDMDATHMITGKALQVVGRTTAPYAAPVTVVATGPVLASAATAPDGSFTLSGLTPGSYYLNVYDAYPGGMLLSKKANVRVVIGRGNKTVVLKGN